jgi:hypothetical protein
MGAAASDGLLPLALDELRKADLLESDFHDAAIGDISRRDILRKLTLAGVATLLVPAIATITAVPAYAQTGAALCNPCSLDKKNPIPCASGLSCGQPGNLCVDPATCGDKNASCTKECDCCKADCKPPDKNGNRICA